MIKIKSIHTIHIGKSLMFVNYFNESESVLIVWGLRIFLRHNPQSFERIYEILLKDYIKFYSL